MFEESRPRVRSKDKKVRSKKVDPPFLHLLTILPSQNHILSSHPLNIISILSSSPHLNFLTFPVACPPLSAVIIHALIIQVKI
jgi:hypothetical protein